NDAGAEPDVVIVLARVVVVRRRERVGVALREGDELRRADLAEEALPRPQAVAAALVAEQRIHQVARAILDAVHLPHVVEERLARVAAARAFCTAGSSRPTSAAMMAITTSNSSSVKPGRRRRGMARPFPWVLRI